MSFPSQNGDLPYLYQRVTTTLVAFHNSRRSVTETTPGGLRGVGISEIVQDGNAYELNKPLGTVLGCKDQGFREDVQHVYFWRAMISGMGENRRCCSPYLRTCIFQTQTNHFNFWVSNFGLQPDLCHIHGRPRNVALHSLEWWICVPPAISR